MLFGAYHHGQTVKDAEWQVRWDKEVAKQADAKIKAEESARAEGLRRINSNQQAQAYAIQSAAVAQTDAAAVTVSFGSVQLAATKLAPDQVAAPAIPPLPLEARQPITPPWCYPTCSRSLINEQQTWLPLLTNPE